jgi:putative ribosome biogenesis GTPase RsgA
MVLFIGPSGVGKSTFINVLAEKELKYATFLEDAKMYLRESCSWMRNK